VKPSHLFVDRCFTRNLLILEEVIFRSFFFDGRQTIVAIIIRPG
jgi:hypothetical protein